MPGPRRRKPLEGAFGNGKTRPLRSPRGRTDGAAVVLMDDPIFATGFEAGVVCAWSAWSGAACP